MDGVQVPAGCPRCGSERRGRVRRDGRTGGAPCGRFAPGRHARGEQPTRGPGCRSPACVACHEPRPARRARSAAGARRGAYRSGRVGKSRRSRGAPCSRFAPGRHADREQPGGGVGPRAAAFAHGGRAWAGQGTGAAGRPRCGSERRGRLRRDGRTGGASCGRLAPGKTCWWRTICGWPWMLRRCAHCLVPTQICRACRCSGWRGGVALSGEVGSPAAAERAVGLAAASIPEGMLVENNLEVGLDLGPLRSLLAGEPGLDGVQVQRVARGVALSGEVASVATQSAPRTSRGRLAPGRHAGGEQSAGDPRCRAATRTAGRPTRDLQGLQVQRLARGVALSGEVGSQAAAERAAVLPLPPSQRGCWSRTPGGWAGPRPRASLIAGEPGLAGVLVQRVARGVALSGEVASVATAERAVRLASASLPEACRWRTTCGWPWMSGRYVRCWAADPDLQDVQVQRLARGVALSGEVGSPAAAERAVGLAVASIPEGMLVENNLEVGLDLGPLRSLMAGEAGLDGVQVQRVARGVALSGEVASVATAERAVRLAAASLPEDMLVENNLRGGPGRRAAARTSRCRTRICRACRCNGWRGGWLSVARWALRGCCACGRSCRGLYPGRHAGPKQSACGPGRRAAARPAGRPSGAAGRAGAPP